MGRKKVFLVIVSSFFLFFLLTQTDVIGNADYAGSESCKACHEEYFAGVMRTAHGKKAVSGSPFSKEGCESCHGPAAEHVDKGGGKGVGIFSFTQEKDAAKRSATCLACHEESKTIAFWNMNRHKSGGVSCDRCHSIHKGAGKSLVAKEPDLCFQCHRDIRAQTNKQSHHPVNEKFVTHQELTCSSCHDTMGGLSTEPVGAFSTRTSFGTNKMIRADSINDLCFKCHTEKRGPFAWEHAPVAENCLSCHEAHGSNHSFLLVRKTPQLCQTCHDLPFHPSQPYTDFQRFLGTGGSKNRFIGRSCLNCHTNIHGSNFPGDSGRFFVR